MKRRRNNHHHSKKKTSSSSTITESFTRTKNQRNQIFTTSDKGSIVISKSQFFINRHGRGPRHKILWSELNTTRFTPHAPLLLLHTLFPTFGIAVSNRSRISIRSCFVICFLVSWPARAILSGLT